MLEGQETPQIENQVFEGDTSNQVFIPETAEQADVLFDKAMAGDINQQDLSKELSSQPSEPSEPNYKLNWGGEEKDLPLSKVIEYAQQGYDYSVKMRDLNRDVESFNAQKQETLALREALKEYEQVQEWAKNNPQLWQHALQSFRQANSNPYQSTEQGTSQFSPEAMGVINGLREEIANLRSEFAPVKQTLQTEAQRREDEMLDTQIKGIMRQYQDLDWVGRDVNGLTLEQRVLNHGVQNGISNFEAAFKHLMYDQLVERAALKAKENVTKDLQKQAPKAPTLAGRKQGLTPPVDIREKTYNDLATEALMELGIRD